MTYPRRPGQVNMQRPAMQVAQRPTSDGRGVGVRPLGRPAIDVLRARDGSRILARSGDPVRPR